MVVVVVAAVVVELECDIKSFENIDSWMNERDKYCISNIFTLIIGTKSDIKKDLITDEMISNLCINYNASYIETSSKINFNIVGAFQLICKKLIEKYNFINTNTNKNINKNINFKLNIDDLQNNKKCCII